MEIENKLNTVLVVEPEQKENLIIDIEGNTLTVKINKNKVFNSLVNRKIIVGFLNKELDLLVEGHLKKGEVLENERNI